MGAEVSFDGPRVAVQIVNPGVVALLLSGDGIPFVFALVLMSSSSILASCASIRLRRLAMESSCCVIC